jgi:hypothetical protein
MIRKVTVILCLFGVVAIACTSAPAPRATPRATPQPPTVGSGDGSEVSVDPADFVSVIDNPYLPFAPGTKFVYQGVKDGERLKDEVTVTDRTKVIMGVRCVVVEDIASEGGKPVEQTEDWYAQDADGNVWYFGEDTKELDEQGKVVSTEGSWQAGVRGAQPGIVMPAHPEVTDSFRQEFLRGQAEDMFWIVSLTERAAVPYGSFGNAMLAFEWTPLEPNVIDRKYYVPGIGVVLEASAAGPREQIQLISVTKP